MMLIVENANAVSNGQLNTRGISKKRIINDDFDSPTVSTCRSSSSSLSASSSLLTLDASAKKAGPESVCSLHNDDCNTTKNNSSSSSSSSSSKNNKRSKRVGFKATASIRYYEIALGDNPSPELGPAIGIGWKYSTGDDISIADAERIPKKTIQQLYLNKNARFSRLWRAGYRKAEIICAIEEAREIQRGREETAALPAPIFVKVGPRGLVWTPSERLLILGDKISRKCLKLSKAVRDEIKSTC